MASWGGWERALLRAMRAPVTSQNLNFLREWQRREGGTASFNPLNTTQHASGASSYNSVGVRNYRNPQQGLQATVQTLLNGHYGDIVSALRAGKAHGGLQSLNTWGTGTWSGAASTRAASVGAEPGGLTPGTPSPPAFTKEDVVRQGLTALAEGHYSPVVGLKALEKAAQATAAAAAKSNSQAFSTGFNAAAIIAPPGKAGTREKQAASLVQNYLGTKYVWGGESPGGFDCSGLIQWVWSHLGVKVPRTSQQQWAAGRPIKGGLRPGDAVFFEMGRGGPGHVGMYIGGGKFVEAPHTGAVVRISSLRGRRDYIGARRFA